MINILCDIIKCNVIDVSHRFRGPCCLLHQVRFLWTLVQIYQATRYRTPEDCHLHSHCCENFELTNSMEQSPSWEADQFSASQEISLILQNVNACHCIHKSPPPVPILSPINPFHAPPFHFLKIHFNIIVPSTPSYSKWSISLRFHHKTSNLTKNT